MFRLMPAQVDYLAATGKAIGHDTSYAADFAQLRQQPLAGNYTRKSGVFGFIAKGSCHAATTGFTVCYECDRNAGQQPVSPAAAVQSFLVAMAMHQEIPGRTRLTHVPMQCAMARGQLMF